MANINAYIILFAYPIVAIILFRRLGLVSGLIWTILAGYLFLPTLPIIKLPVPGLPNIDKDFVPAFCALVLVWAQARRQKKLTRIMNRRGKGEKPRLDEGVQAGQSAAPSIVNEERRSRGGWLINLLVVMAIFGPVLTTMTNGEALFRFEGFVQPGFGLYDAGRAIITATVMLLPFFLARRYLATPDAHLRLIQALVIAGICYGFLTLYEVRMAPTLNSKLYGFFAHEWRQHIRSDGYRAILFLHHGLRVALFLAMAAVAMAVAFRLPEYVERRALLFVCLIFMMGVLVLDKSLGALATAIILVPVALLLTVRTQIWVSAVLAATILLYPMLRGAGVVPVERVVSVAESINPERAASLAVRLRSEEILLNRASLKPVVGWGGMARWYVFDERGRSTIPDGIWVITIGQFGWLGYLAQFGLLTVPILLTAFRRRALSPSMSTMGLVLVLTANLIDLIPNSGLTPLTWLFAGALAGWYERQRRGIATQNKVATPVRMSPLRSRSV